MRETLCPEPRVLELGLETPATRAGGLNHYFADLCAALADMGVGVRALTLGEEPPEKYSSWWTVSGRRDQQMFRRLWRSYRLARRSDVDLVDSHFALSGLLPTALGPLRQLPLVVHFQGPWADESALAGSSKPASWVKRQVERQVYTRADALVVLSQAFRRMVMERYQITPWEISVIPPGVDLERFHQADRTDVRARLDVPLDCWVALCVRRLVPRMGIDVLLKAWEQVVDRADRPVRLVVVGDGPARPDLEERAAELGITGSVYFLGRVESEDLVAWYQAADVSVVPSVALEGFGLVVVESLACGTPVVASSVDGLVDALGRLDEGLLVPPGDSDGLARRLAEAQAGIDPLPTAATCRQFAEKFSWNDVAQRHRELYRRVIRPSPPKALRVVVLGHTAQLSGGELALFRLIRALDEVDVHVILAEEGPLVGLLERAGISVEVLSMGESSRGLGRDRVTLGGIPGRAGLGTAAYVLRLARRLRSIRPDLVHTNTLKAALYGGLAARLVGIPCLWHIRDRIASDYLPAGAVRMVRLAARVLPTEVIANSGSTLSTLGLSAGRGVVIPSPIDVDPASGRSRSDGVFRVAMVGRLAPWKGQDLFIQAFAEAFPQGAEQAVVVGSAMFGEDGYAADLRALTLGLGLEDRLEFRGFQSNIGAELGSVDALVHASVVPEPFGQVVVEGMAAGLPVVAAAAGGPAEVITDGVDGILYPPGDVTALAGHLRRLAADPSLRSQLGAAGQATAGRYRPDVIAPQVVAVYQRVRRPSGR